MSTVAELDELLARRAAERDAITADMKAIKHRRDVECAKGTVVQKLGLANAAERAALLQLMSESGGLDSLIQTLGK